MARPRKNAGNGNELPIIPPSGSGNEGEFVSDAIGGNVDAGDTGNIIDPAAVIGSAGGSETSGSADGGQPPKRRGRKPGTGTGPRKPRTAALAVDGLSATLLSIHGMLAAITNSPDWNISEAEAKMLAEASSNVASFYDIGASEKTIAWSNLGIAAAAIYGPRLFNASKRKPKSAQPPASPAPARKGNSGNLTEIPGIGVVDLSAGMPQ